MEKLPAELHIQIAAFCNECELEDLSFMASVEPGASVRALSSVSRYFYAVSEPLLYQTVCVRGISQASMLVQTLENSSKSNRLRVENMFLSDDVVDSRPEPLPSSSLVNIGNLATIAPCTRPTSMSTSALNTLTRLLTLCAPSLRVLSISLSSSSPTFFARMFRNRLPELISLSIIGLYPFPSTLNTFPKLKHLELSGNPNPSGLLSMGGLEDACPVLSRLEIRGLKAGGCFVKEVEEAVWSGSITTAEESGLAGPPDVRDLEPQVLEDEDIFRPRLPSTLRHVVLQTMEQKSSPAQISSTFHFATTLPRGIHLSIISPASGKNMNQFRTEWMSVIAA